MNSVARIGGGTRASWVLLRTCEGRKLWLGKFSAQVSQENRRYIDHHLSMPRMLKFGSTGADLCFMFARIPPRDATWSTKR